ncbi:MAG: RidA family protein [Betaproteobacteria bacterium]
MPSSIEIAPARDARFQRVAADIGHAFDGEIRTRDVYIECTPDFTQQSEVADAVSDVLHPVQDAAGMHARTSIGVCQLPKNATVERYMTAAIDRAAPFDPRR